MMDVLDQSEVDALLSAVDSGDVEEKRPETTRVFSRTRRDMSDLQVTSYDFKRPERVSKDQMRALQTLHESFARNFGASLSGFLRTIIEVKVASCDQMTYSEFIAGLPNPTSFNLLKPGDLEGQMCLEISPLITYPIIDRLLGGTNDELFIPQRPMTMIERRLIGRLTDRAVEALGEAWTDLREMSFEVVGGESNPQLVQIVPPNEVVVVVGFEIKMTNRAGTMNLCIPYAVIEPMVDDLAAQSWFNTGRLRKAPEHFHNISDRLSKASVEVTGTLAETTITLRDLFDLSVGDLLLTGKPAKEPVVLSVEGERVLWASVGQHRDKRALKIGKPIGKNEIP